MIELSNIDENTYKLSYAGDTANSAIYLSRLGAKSSYITSVGNDLLSKKMVNFLKKEKVNTDNIHYNKNKTIGLYVIKNNNKGERNFFYWRSDSAAKSLFGNINLNVLFNKVSKYEAIYFSGITLIKILKTDVKNISYVNLSERGTVGIIVETKKNQYINFDIPRERLTASNPHQLLVLMV